MNNTGRFPNTTAVRNVQLTQSSQKHKPSLREAVAWTSGGALASAAGRWGILVVLAKLGAAETVGQFALAMAVATPITAFGRLALRAVVATDTEHQFRFQDYLTLQLLTVPVCLAVLGAVVFICRFDGGVASTVLLVGGAQLVVATSSVFYGFMQKHERVRRLGLSLAVKGAGAVLAVGGVYFWTDSLAWAVAAMGAWWLLILLVHDVPFVARLLREVEGDALLRRWPTVQVLRRIAWVCLPVGATAVLRDVNANLPRYFVQTFLGSREMGFFAAVAACARVGQLLFRGVGQAVGPRLAGYHKEQSDAYLKLLTKLLLLCAALGAVGLLVVIVAGDWILSFVYRAEYVPYHAVFVWLMVGVIFSLGAAMLRSAMIAGRYLRVHVTQIMLTTAVIAASCLLLIPPYGLYGAAGAVVAGSAFELFVGLAMLTRRRRNEFQQTRQRAADAVERASVGSNAPQG